MMCLVSLYITVLRLLYCWVTVTGSGGGWATHMNVDSMSTHADEPSDLQCLPNPMPT